MNLGKEGEKLEFKKTISELNGEKLVREVGESYGLSDGEMDEVVVETIIWQRNITILQ